MSLHSPQSLPHRDSYYNFSRFAPTIVSALRQYPNVIVVDPQELSVETFAQRLRDAANACLRYGHKFPGLDPVDMTERWPTIKVSMRALPGKLVIGPNESIKQFGNKPVGLTQGGNEIVLQSQDEKALADVCSLLSRRCLMPCPIVLVTGFLASVYQEMEEKFDVVIEPHPSRQGWMQVL